MKDFEWVCNRMHVIRNHFEGLHEHFTGRVVNYLIIWYWCLLFLFNLPQDKFSKFFFYLSRIRVGREGFYHFSEMIGTLHTCCGTSDGSGCWAASFHHAGCQNVSRFLGILTVLDLKKKYVVFCYLVHTAKAKLFQEATFFIIIFT